MNSEALFYDICGVQCKNERGLLYHKQRAYRHNNNKYENSAKNFLNENSTRILIPYENFDEIEDDNLVKKSKPQYVDIDKLESRIDSKYDGSDYEEEEFNIKNC